MLSDSLHAVVLANERFVLRRLALQSGLIALSIVGIVVLPSPWWWGCLVLLVMLAAGAAQSVFFILHWNRHPLDRPWRALALGARHKKEQVLELHGHDGEVLHLPVPLTLLEGLLEAAQAEGATVVRDAAERLQVTALSARIEIFRRMEALLPQVPTPSLREEVSAVFTLIRSRDPLAKNAALNAPLHELKVKLMAEESVQTDSPLRGPKAVFGSEIKALVDALTGLVG